MRTGSELVLALGSMWWSECFLTSTTLASSDDVYSSSFLWRHLTSSSCSAGDLPSYSFGFGPSLWRLLVQVASSLGHLEMSTYS